MSMFSGGRVKLPEPFGIRGVDRDRGRLQGKGSAGWITSPVTLDAGRAVS